MKRILRYLLQRKTPSVVHLTLDFANEEALETSVASLLKTLPPESVDSLLATVAEGLSPEDAFRLREAVGSCLQRKALEDAERTLGWR